MSLKLRKAAALAALIAVVVPVGNAIAVELPPLDTQSIACREAAGFDALDVFRKPPVPQAISLCEQQAAGQAHPEVLAYLGRAYYFAGRHADARRVIEKAHDGGSVAGTALMGVLYENGYGVQKDEAQAATWFRNAAEQGNANAQHNLGVMYENGRGVTKDEVRAVAWYRKADEQGYAVSQRNLGAMYANGRGVSKDEVQAVAWYRKAAEQGNVDAQINLGFMYENGRGIEKDEVQAVAWYRQAAEQGNAKAQANLGVMYAHGRGVAKNEAQAVAWFHKAAEQGNAVSQRNLGAMYENGNGVEKNEVQAAAWYRKAAEQGDADAQHYLGLMYAHGRGIPSDQAEALRLFQQAGESTDEAYVQWLMRLPVNGAITHLATLRRAAPQRGIVLHVRYLTAAQLWSEAIREAEQYLVSSDYKTASAANRDDVMAKLREVLADACSPKFSGDVDLAVLERLVELGIPEAALQLARLVKADGATGSEAQAVEWLRKAASQGEPSAQVELGWRHSTGSGAEKSDEAAVAWYRKAAEQGDANAQNNLGVMYEGGRSVAQDDAQAATWYRKAAEQNHALAQRALGFMYANGRGVAKDDAQAVAWYRKAAEQGHAQGQNSLGYMYAYGRGVAKDEVQAVVWYRKAAEQGYALSQSSMGFMYEKGRGVEKDDVQAAAWYRKAADQGDAWAQNKLGSMYEHGHGVEKDGPKAVAWYRKAAAQGSDAAREHLARLTRAEGSGAASATPAISNDLVTPSVVDTGMALAPPTTAAKPATQRHTAVSAERAASEVASLHTAARRDTARNRWKDAAASYERIADWHLAANQVDQAVAARLQEIALLDIESRTFFGSGDNYFHLLASSCRWSRTARWAVGIGHPEAALLMAKFAVNRLQQARHQLGQLNDSLKECFLKVHEDRYRWLADLLLDMGRVGEAEQVLAMLKHFEVEEYVRGDSPRESAQVEFAFGGRQRALLDGVAALQAQMHAAATAQRLIDTEATGRKLTADEQRQLDTAQAALEQAQSALDAGMQAMLDDLRGLRQASGPETAQEAALQAAVSIQGSLRDVFGGRAVVVQSVVLPHRIHLLVTTADTQQVVRVDVPRRELARLVTELRQAVQSPRADPRPMAQRLHQLLIAPIQPLLENAETLMVSADDTLRYLPFAVLHDGQRYLAERYALSNYSPTTRDIAVAPVRRPTWRVAAFGATQGQPELKLSALPGVVGELRAVVRQDGEQQGALPGQRLLDADFTRESFSRALRRRFPAVHIASHFRLAFNDSQASVMLLGDGQTLPMAAFGGNATTFPLRDIDLLTLSACETAVPVGQDVATGTEVESLSALVHRAGARSVLATLWPVADQATSVFMGRQYTYLADGDGTSKAEALRRTQLDFIQGQTHSGVTGEAGTQRGARRSDTGASSSAPDGWTHPYYWAPFTLLGNWM